MVVIFLFWLIQPPHYPFSLRSLGHNKINFLTSNNLMRVMRDMYKQPANVSQKNFRTLDDSWGPDCHPSTPRIY